MKRVLMSLVVLFLIAAACGDDDGASTTTTTSQSTTSAAPSGDGSTTAAPSGSTTTTATSAPSTTSSTPVVGSEDFCGAVEDVDPSDIGFGADADTLRDSLQRTLSALREAEGNAPSEIRDDLSIVVDGFAGFVELLEEVDYNFLALGAAAATDPRITRFEEQEFIDAAERVSAYCGVDLELGDTGDEAPDGPGDLPDLSNDIPEGFPAEFVPPGVTEVLNMGGGAVLFTTSSTFAELVAFYRDVLGAPQLSDENADLAVWAGAPNASVLGVAVSPGNGSIDVLVTLNP